MRRVLFRLAGLVLSFLSPGLIFYRHGRFGGAVFVTLAACLLDVLVIYFVYFQLPVDSAGVRLKIDTFLSYCVGRILLVALLCRYSPRLFWFPTTDGRLEGHAQGVLFVLAGYAFALGIFFASIFTHKTSNWGFYSSSSLLSVPAVYPGDVVVVQHHYYRRGLPKHGDLVVYQRRDNIFLSRVAGVAGDQVGIRNGVLFLNGKSLLVEQLQDCVSLPTANSSSFKYSHAVIEKAGYNEYLVSTGSCDQQIKYDLAVIEVPEGDVLLVHDNRSEFGDGLSASPAGIISMSVNLVRTSQLMHRPLFVHRTTSEDLLKFRFK